MKLVAEVIRGKDGLEQLAPQWSHFNAAHPLLTHDCFAASAAALYPSDSVYTVAVRDDTGLQAVAPLALNGATFELLGSSITFEPNGVLYANDAALIVLAAALADLPGAVVLARVADGATLAGALRRHAGKVLLRPASPVPFIAMNRPWEEYDATLSARRRQDMRRDWRRLERVDSVAVVTSFPSASEWPGVLERAGRIESSGWKGRTGTGLAHNASVRAFLAAYGARGGVRGKLRVSFLQVGDRSIATQIDVIHAHRVWVLKIGYDEAWRQYSPGTQLTYRLIEQAFRAGYEAYEFLGNHEAWLDVWLPSFRPHQTVMYYPFKSVGLRALAVDFAGYIGRRLRRSS